MLNQQSTDELAKILWDYHHLNHELEKADCILVLGSHDVRVAEYGAELFLKGLAPLIIFSGNKGRLTESWERPEAEVFAEAAIKMGVPKDKILIENKSTNTGENILFTKKILEENGINLQKIILVHKPYMERRTYATFKKLWPEKDIIVTSPPIPFEKYPNKDILEEYFVNSMVADFQRIMLYPKKGFQIKQEIPPEVEMAFNELVKRGFNKNLIKEGNN